MPPDVLDDPAAAFQHEQTRDQVVEKGSIVAHHQQCAPELPDALLQHLERLEVEIVRRLVEQEKVGGAGEQPRQEKPVPLAAGQRPHRIPGPARGEQEVAQVPEDVNRLPAHRQVISAVEHRIGDGRVLGEPFAFLVEIGDLKAGPVPHFAVRRLQLAEEQPDERGLADPVRADDPDAVAALDQTGEVFHQRRTGIAEGDPGRFDRPPSGALALGVANPEFRAVRTIPAGRAVAPHVVEPAHPAHVASAPRLGAAANPRLLRRESTLEALHFERLRRPALVAPAQEVVVVARPRRHVAAIDLDDAVRDPAQEGPVMGREHEPSPIAREFLLEPFDGGDVEMVRRLVEEQEVRLPDHGPGQQDASLLSARQRLEGGLGSDAGLLQGALDPPVTVPALGRGPFVKSRRHDVSGRAGKGAGKNLGDEGDRESRCPLEVPGIRFAMAGENREESGFTCPVASGKADTVAGRKLQLDVREQHVGADIGTDVAGSQQAHAVQGYRYPPRRSALNDASSLACARWLYTMNATMEQIRTSKRID